VGEGGTRRNGHWFIIMAIKRLTIELDDLPDTAKATSLPAPLTGKAQTLPVEREKTSTPEQQADYQQPEIPGQKQDSAIRSETIGRTPADLVFAFVNRPEFMATTLTFLSFLISVGKFQHVNDVWIPVVISAILNGVWFGIVVLKRLFISK
jgi:hypothetical protein